MSVSAVPNEESDKYLVVWIIPSQIYEQNNLNFDPSIIMLRTLMYSSCAHCKRNFFLQIKMLLDLSNCSSKRV